MNINKESIIVYIKTNIKTILIALVTSLILVVCGFYYFKGSSDEPKQVVTFFDNKVQEKDKEQDEKNQNDSKIVVDIKGEVNKPGVYETTKDKRVKDLIDEAGGLTEQADTTNINLSQKVKDQMVINVNKKGEKPNSSDSSTTTDKEIININTANKEQLMKISGVGESKAKAIIEYRETKGEFQKKEDITKVKGIGKATYEKIKDSIEV